MTDTSKYPVIAPDVRAARKVKAVQIRAEIARLEAVWGNRDTVNVQINAAATIPQLRTFVAGVAMEVARIARDVAAIGRLVGGEDR